MATPQVPRASSMGVLGRLTGFAGAVLRAFSPEASSSTRAGAGAGPAVAPRATPAIGEATASAPTRDAGGAGSASTHARVAARSRAASPAPLLAAAPSAAASSSSSAAPRAPQRRAHVQSGAPADTSDALSLETQLAAARAQGALEERVRALEQRARDAEARAAAAETSLAARAATSTAGTASAPARAASTLPAPSARACAGAAAGGADSADADAGAAAADGDAASLRDARARDLCVRLLAMGLTKPRTLPATDKALLATLEQTEDAVGYALRLCVMRPARDLVLGLKPKPSAHAFVEGVAKGKHEAAMTQILKRDKVTHSAASGPIKTAATATRVVQIAVVGACVLANVQLPRSLSSTFSGTADEVKAITAALGVGADATLGDAFVAVRERCGYDPALSAAAANMESGARAPTSEEADEEEERDRDGDEGFGRPPPLKSSGGKRTSKPRARAARKR
jgi:hypothetical protein